MWQFPCYVVGVGEAVNLLDFTSQDGVRSDVSSFFGRGGTCLWGGTVGLKQAFFSLLVSFFSSNLEIHVSPSKKQSCPPDCISINFVYHSFDYYLVCFWCFFKFRFCFQFHPWEFYLIFVSNLILILLIAIFFVFYHFLDLLVFQFHPRSFYCIYFFIQFWSSFYWLLFFYLYFSISF
jgi:hypothetical protein